MAIQDVQLLVAQAKLEASNPAFKVMDYSEQLWLELSSNRHISRSMCVLAENLVLGVNNYPPQYQISYTLTWPRRVLSWHDSRLQPSKSRYCISHAIGSPRIGGIVF
jgi:hypothetical protein